MHAQLGLNDYHASGARANQPDPPPPPPVAGGLRRCRITAASPADLRTALAQTDVRA